MAQLNGQFYPTDQSPTKLLRGSSRAASVTGTPRFLLPQMQSSSPSINQANSEDIKSKVQPSNDVFSGAKAGVQNQIRTAMPRQDEQTQVEDTSPYTNMPEKETTAVVPSVKTGLGQSYEDEAANMVRNAYKSPVVDDLRNQTQKYNQAQNEYANFDPQKQPVSKLRKGLSIGAGIVTGLTGGGMQGGMNAYNQVAHGPAYEQQAQLKRKADVAGLEQGVADKNVKAVQELATANKGLADTMQNVAKDTAANDVYNQTGRAEAQAKTGLDVAQTGKAQADTQVALRPPEPKIVNTPETDKSSVISLDPKTNNWSIKPMNEPGNKGIQKLSATEEPIVRGWLAKNGNDPNTILKGYMDGDPKSSALVYQALHDEAISRNPGMIFNPGQLIPTYDATGGQTGAIEYDPKSHTMTPKSLSDLGLGEGGTIKTPNKPLDAVSYGQYKGALNTKKVVEDIANSLYPSSTNPQAQAKAKNLRDQLGPLAGRLTDVEVGKLGLKDPEVAELYQRIQSAAIFAASSHSGRITPAFIEEFKKSMAGIAQDPENFKARLKVLMEVAQDVRETIEQTSPNATQVQAQKQLEAKSNGVPATHTFNTEYNGKSYHFDSQDKLDKFKQKFNIK